MFVLEDCPICKEKGLPPHKPKRLISGGSGKGIVELTGNELTQSIKDGTQKLKRDVYSNEKAYSNFIGESRYQNIQTGLDKGKRDGNFRRK
jgi:hypothetical protein